jgi:hypothetical protein
MNIIQFSYAAGPSTNPTDKVHRSRIGRMERWKRGPSATLGTTRCYFVGSLTKAILLRPAFEASARVSATKR